MSLDIRRSDHLTAPERLKLSGDMAAFYHNPPASYYAIADGSAMHYQVEELPFHCDLVSQVQSGDSVMELGCGTAHLCAQVEARGGRYTGLDYSEALLEANRQRFPQARFHSIVQPIVGLFDIVASLYTIEHVVDPLAYLRRLWEHCRPGGRIAVICPEFVDSPELPPSLFFGHTPRRIRSKLRSLSLSDAVAHCIDLKWRAAGWKRVARSAPPGAFWLNLRPRVLHGAEYGIDADAIHLVRRLDIEWFLRQLGAEIIRTSANMPEVSPEVLRFNSYVLARKPELTA